MANTESTIKRATDVSGDLIKTYKDGSEHVQAVGIADDEGTQTGVGANPLRVADDTLELILREVRVISTGMAVILGQRGEEE